MHQRFLGKQLSIRVLQSSEACLELLDGVVLHGLLRAFFDDASLLLCGLSHDQGGWLLELVLGASGDHGVVGGEAGKSEEECS